jgi:hypothetical protein
VNQDFKDLLAAFANASVRYLIVGGYAVIRHTEPRYTKDLDLWVARDAENAQKVFTALTDFGAPLTGLSPADFTEPGYYFTMGLDPGRIDIWFDLPGVDFEGCWDRRVLGSIGGFEVCFISRRDLIVNKETVARLQDLADVEKLRLTSED